MCLVAIAWRASPLYPLVVAGNRDEFHDRPTAAAGWWENAGHVLGGRDLVAGGSWLAVSRGGRFAVVVNDPRRPPGAGHTRSRGALVREFVTGETPSGRFLDAVAVTEGHYAGFSLVVGTRVQLRGFLTAGSGSPHRWTLPVGISVLTNAPRERPPPKAGLLEAGLRAALGATVLDRETVFGLLGRREPVGDSPGDEHPAARAPFVLGDRYGTRASTLLLMDAEGRCSFEERRFDAGGAPAGSSREEFLLR